MPSKWKKKRVKLACFGMFNVIWLAVHFANPWKMCTKLFEVFVFLFWVKLPFDWCRLSPTILIRKYTNDFNCVIESNIKAAKKIKLFYELRTSKRSAPDKDQIKTESGILNRKPLGDYAKHDIWNQKSKRAQRQWLMPD